MDIVIHNLKFAYGEQLVFDDFSMEVKDGETLCIMGASGCGKTTLLKLLTGSLRPQSGTIEGLSGAKIGMVFQENRLCEEFTAAANIHLAAGRKRETGKTVFLQEAKDEKNPGMHRETREKGTMWHQRLGDGHFGRLGRIEIEAHLAQVGLEDVSEKRVLELSGGMKRRVAIVRAILAPSDVLIMDEPFKGLDQETKQQVMAYVKQYKGRRTLILVTHDAEEVQSMGGQLLEL